MQVIFRTVLVMLALVSAALLPESAQANTAGCDALYLKAANAKGATARRAAYAVFLSKCKGDTRETLARAAMAPVEEPAPTVVKSELAPRAFRPDAMNISASAQQWQSQCNAGALVSCDRLGKAFETGYSSESTEKSSYDAPQDFGRAQKLYERACDGGLASGCFNLASAVDRGIFEKVDPATSSTLFERACVFGEGRACELLDFRYRQETESPSDQQRANQFRQKACDLKVVGECISIIESYINKEKIDWDFKKAFIFISDSCDKNEAYYNYCATLGLTYYFGLGVTKNVLFARQLWQADCLRFDQSVSCKYLEKYAE